MQNAFAKDRPVFQEVLKTWLTNENNRRMFARRILELDMSAIDQTPICYYGSQINVKQMTETVFDLISY
jgi:predicted acylesterase/phospholipase RssA